MPYEAVVFDMDGVLLTGYHTPREVYREAAVAILEAHGVDASPPAALVDPDEANEARAAIDALGLDPEATWEARERASDERENERIAAGERVLFEDVDVLADLDRPLGVVSNNRQGTVDFVIDHFGLPVAVARGRDPTFDGFDRMKPDPGYLQDVLRELDVAPSATLYVGDRRSDVRTARNAGTDAALLVRDGDPPDGGPEPDYTISTLRDLVGLV